MDQSMKSEVSKSNKYWIERHRYYELKHFCMQFPIWKKMIDQINLYQSHGSLINLDKDKVTYKNSTIEEIVHEKIIYESKINLIEETAYESDREIGPYILIGVTKGIPYKILRLNYKIPCCKNTYYNLYRKFFWVLDNKRDSSLI